MCWYDHLLWDQAKKWPPLPAAGCARCPWMMILVRSQCIIIIQKVPSDTETFQQTNASNKALFSVLGQSDSPSRRPPSCWANSWLLWRDRETGLQLEGSPTDSCGYANMRAGRSVSCAYLQTPGAKSSRKIHNAMQQMLSGIFIYARLFSYHTLIVMWRVGGWSGVYLASNERGNLSIRPKQHS